jgi:hypothetical protein
MAIISRNPGVCNYSLCKNNISLLYKTSGSTVTIGLGVLGAMWEVFLLPKILFSISFISASIHNHNPHLSSASKFKRKNSNLQKKTGVLGEGEKLLTQKSFKKAIGSFAM